jgi:hypothetical protein
MSFGNNNYNSNRGGGARTNRFGEPEKLITLHAAVNKKSGQVYDSIFKGYVEINNVLYKIEVSNRNKETKTGNPAMWCKVTKKPKRSTSAVSF